MTATRTITSTSTTKSTTRPGAKTLWKTGAVAGVTAAVATTGFAAVAQAAGASLEVGGKEIPLLGFAQMTLVGAIIGTILAVVLSRRARRPQWTFIVTTVALTALSFVPDLTADASSATKLALVLSHVIAAAIVIPALASRLSD